MIEMGKTGNLIRTINIVDRRAPTPILYYVTLPACVYVCVRARARTFRLTVVIYVVDEWFRGVAARVASLQRRITEFRTQCSGPLRASRQPLDFVLIFIRYS